MLSTQIYLKDTNMHTKHIFKLEIDIKSKF
jgi:hypothetical protein